MDCNKCQNNIDEFIHDILDLQTASRFAKHIRTCPQCYNELEINYCMQTAIAELHDESEMTSGDFTGSLKQKLDKAIENYEAFKKNYKRKRALILTFLVFAGLFIGL